MEPKKVETTIQSIETNMQIKPLHTGNVEHKLDCKCCMCKAQRHEPKVHKPECKCACCQRKRNEPLDLSKHKESCRCIPCRLSRGESVYKKGQPIDTLNHKKDCCCFTCNSKRNPKDRKRSEEHTAKIIAATKARRIPRETRTCACGCTNTFACRPKDPKRFIRGHHLKMANLNRVDSPRMKFGNTKNELLIRAILDDLKCEYIPQHPIRDIKNYFKADFYVPKLKLVIETDGIYWHAWPGKYKADDLIKYPKGVIKKASEIWEKDRVRTEEMRQAGYKVLRFWENQFNKSIVQEAIKGL